MVTGTQGKQEDEHLAEERRVNYEGWETQQKNLWMDILLT